MDILNNIIELYKSFKGINKIYDFISYYFLCEIKTYKYNKCFKYKRTKELFNSVPKNLEIVNRLLDVGNFQMAASCLRTILEDIIYLLYRSLEKYKDIPTDFDKLPGFYRNEILDEQVFKELFGEYIDPSLIKMNNDYLCKICHPNAMKEIITNLNSSFNIKRYFLFDLKSVELQIEFMYLVYLNSKNKDDRIYTYFDFSFVLYFCQLINYSFLNNNIKEKRTLINGYIANPKGKFVRNINENKDITAEATNFIKDESNRNELFEMFKNACLRIDDNMIKSIYKHKFSEILD